MFTIKKIYNSVHEHPSLFLYQNLNVVFLQSYISFFLLKKKLKKTNEKKRENITYRKNKTKNNKICLHLKESNRQINKRMFENKRK